MFWQGGTVNRKKNLSFQINPETILQGLFLCGLFLSNYFYSCFFIKSILKLFQSTKRTSDYIRNLEDVDS